MWGVLTIAAAVIVTSVAAIKLLDMILNDIDVD